jgi:hypothetical protein
MTTRALIGLALVLAALAAEVRPAAGTLADNCTLQSRRVRIPTGFMEGRLSYAALLKNGRQRVGETFASANVRELWVTATWTDAEDAHVQRVDLFAPDGSLYQRFTTVFTGARRPVSVMTRVPVAGSSIIDSGLYGEWCAELFLDDEDAPIARRRFDLTP